jgi:BlaI family transcriptional regulator, penicillinase repressor
MSFTLYIQALGDLETRIMHQLWANGPMTIRELHYAMAPKHEIAYTTVMTSADRMYQKGLLSREVLGSHCRAAFRYTAALTRAELIARAIEKICVDLGADASDRQIVYEVLAAY